MLKRYYIIFSVRFILMIFRTVLKTMDSERHKFKHLENRLLWILKCERNTFLLFEGTLGVIFEPNCQRRIQSHEHTSCFELISHRFRHMLTFMRNCLFPVSVKRTKVVPLRSPKRNCNARP